MFDISFSELLIIAVIALVVLGPERMPKVARTLGHLLGRAQRYMHDVKRDIQREMDLDEFKDIKKEMEEASSSVKDSISKLEKNIEDPLKEARSAIEELGKDTEKIAQQAKAATEDLSKEVEQAATTDQGKSTTTAIEESTTEAVSDTETHDTQPENGQSGDTPGSGPYGLGRPYHEPEAEPEPAPGPEPVSDTEQQEEPSDRRRSDAPTR